MWVRAHNNCNNNCLVALTDKLYVVAEASCKVFVGQERWSADDDKNATDRVTSSHWRRALCTERALTLKQTRVHVRNVSSWTQVPVNRVVAGFVSRLFARGHRVRADTGWLCVGHLPRGEGGLRGACPWRYDPDMKFNEPWRVTCSDGFNVGICWLCTLVATSLPLIFPISAHVHTHKRTHPPTTRARAHTHTHTHTHTQYLHPLTRLSCPRSLVLSEGDVVNHTMLCSGRSPQKAVFSVIVQPKEPHAYCCRGVPISTMWLSAPNLLHSLAPCWYPPIPIFCSRLSPSVVQPRLLRPRVPSLFPFYSSPNHVLSASVCHRRAMWHSGACIAISIEIIQLQIMCCHAGPRSSSFTPRCSSCVKEYIAVDSGGSLCTNSLRIRRSVAEFSPEKSDDVRVYRPEIKWDVEHFEQS